jgi:hypothetical protein
MKGSSLVPVALAVLVGSAVALSAADARQDSRKHKPRPHPPPVASTPSATRAEPITFGAEAPCPSAFLSHSAAARISSSCWSHFRLAG